MVHLKSVLTGVAAAFVSLFLSIPLTLTVVDRMPASGVASTPTSQGGISFQSTVIDVNLLPAIVVAPLAFLAGFFWMRRRASRTKP